MNGRLSAPCALRRPLALLACLGLVLATAVQAQDTPQAINPPELPPAHGYSHVMVAPPGRMVSISGQVAMDREGKVVGEATSAPSACRCSRTCASR